MGKQSIKIMATSKASKDERKLLINAKESMFQTLLLALELPFWQEEAFGLLSGELKHMATWNQATFTSLTKDFQDLSFQGSYFDIYSERNSAATQEGMRETDVELGNLEEPPSIPTIQEDEAESLIPRVPGADSPNHTQHLLRVFGQTLVSISALM